jgi:hypothetical protein
MALRRFSWESSTTGDILSAAKNDRGRVSSVDREQLGICTSKGKEPAQSARQNMEQSTTQSIALKTNDTHLELTSNKSFQNRNEAPLSTTPSSAPTMIARRPTTIGATRRADPHPSPLVYESHKRDGWVLPDDIMAILDGTGPNVSTSEDSDSDMEKPSRQSRFDSAVEKNTSYLAQYGNTSENHSDVLAYTWPRGRLGCNRTASTAPKNSASPSSGLPSKGAPSVLPKNGDAPHEVGRWSCCMCDGAYTVLQHMKGPNIISPLSCECSHRPCQDCEFSGYIKMYCPVDGNPAMIHTSGNRDEPIKFGAICRGCGSSWRAQPVKKAISRMRTVLHKLSGLLKRLHKTHSLQMLRHASASMMNLSRPESSLSKTRSFANLRSASETKKRPETSTKEVVEQASHAKVTFFGIVCSCGRITEPESVCFQITDVLWGSPEADLVRETGEIRERIGSTSPPELQEKGHRERDIRLKGGVHPNPLLSSPVDEFHQQSQYMGGQPPSEPGDHRLRSDWY